MKFLAVLLSLFLLALPTVVFGEELLWQRILTGDSLQKKLDQVYHPPIDEAARQDDTRTLSRKEFSVNNQLPLMKFVEAMSLNENDSKRALLLETIVTLYPKFPLNSEIQYLLGQNYMARYQENPQSKILREKSEKAFNAFIANSPQQRVTLNSYPFEKGHIKAGIYLGPYTLMSLANLYTVPPVTREGLTQALDELNKVSSLFPETFDENGESLKLLAIIRQIGLIRENPRLLDAKAMAAKAKELDSIMEYSDRSLSVAGEGRTYIYPYYYESLGEIFFNREEYDSAISYFKELILEYGDTVKWSGKGNLLEGILQRATQNAAFEPHAIRFYQSLADGDRTRGYAYAYWIPLIYDQRGDYEKAIAQYKTFLIRYAEGLDYVEKNGKFVPTELTLAKDRIEALMTSVDAIEALYQEIENEAPAQGYDLDYRISRLYDQAGEKEKALVLYQQLVKKYNMYPDKEESLFISRKTQKGLAKERIIVLMKELNLEE